MVPLHSLIPLFAATASILLAGLVYGQALDRRVGLVFSFLAITLAFWNLNFFALYAIQSYENALYWSRVFRTGGLFLVPATLHLCLVLPGRKISRPWSSYLVVTYSFFLWLAVLNVSGSLVTHLQPFAWGYYSVGSPYYNAFAGAVIVSFGCSLFIVVTDYITTSEPRMRLQLKFWLIGMVVALPLGLTNLLPSYGIHFYPLGNLGSAVWAAIVGYAIARYRLMDVEVVVAKGLAYVLVVLVVVGPGSAVVLSLQSWAFHEVHYDFSAVLMLLLVVTGIAFPRLKQSIEKQLERRLFPQKFEARAALGSLAGELVRVLDRDRLVDVLCEKLVGAMGLESVSMFVREEVRGRYELAAYRGAQPVRRDFGGENLLVRLLAKTKEAILREEMPSGYGSDAGEGVPLQEGGSAEWSACVPLVNGPDLLGFLCLGRKPALQAYTAGDLVLLSEVGVGAGVALQNARLYGELRRSREMINRAGRLSALGTLAAGIAHEIRNPLVSIQTFFQLAPERLGDEEFMTSFLKLAEAEVQRISSLVSELLTFAKSPSRTVEEVDLNEVVDRTSTLIEPQARSQGVDLRVSYGEDLHRVMADPDQVMQVLLNIGLNGIQATPRGGVVTLETRNILSEGSRFAQVEVSDSGTGISEELKESIFDPFFTTKEKGTGLGLSIAHQIVAEAGGFIGFESSEGRGARFLINLPAALGENS